MKTPTENLKGISIQNIVESRDVTTACQVMMWMRVRGFGYRGTMRAIAENASAQGYTDYDPNDWDALLQEGA